MSELALLHDDGALAAAAARRRWPVPATALLTAATLVALAGAVRPPTGPGWAWAAGGATLALVARAGRSGALGWLGPGLLRALEYGLALALVGPGPAAFALLGALSLHHYDLAYRGRLRGLAPPRWLLLALGGWELRTAALIVAAALGVATPTAAALAVIVAGARVAEAAVAWTARAPTTDEPATTGARAEEER